jgi:hypothetical protein
MKVMNELDRFHLVSEVFDFVENMFESVDAKTKWSAAYVRQEMHQLLIKHKNYIREFGVESSPSGVSTQGLALEIKAHYKHSFPLTLSSYFITMRCQNQV